MPFEEEIFGTLEHLGKLVVCVNDVAIFGDTPMLNGGELRF